MASADPFDSALDLLRRLNPKDTSRNVSHLCALAPSLTEDLLESVDVPLATKRDRKSGRDFLCCDYNRDGDSWRSPWSNEFEPPLGDDGEEGGVVPSERVRKMEVKANEAFDVYRELYYEGGISSVYFWDVDDGFAGCVLLKKSVSPSQKSTGSWDSIHVFEALDRARTAHYKLTSTVILSLGSDAENIGAMDLSGNMVRQVEADMPVEDDGSHVANIGKMVEDMELKMRNLLQEVYFGKGKWRKSRTRENVKTRRHSGLSCRVPLKRHSILTTSIAKDVVGDLRTEPGMQPLSQTSRDRATQREMISNMTTS